MFSGLALALASQWSLMDEQAATQGIPTDYLRDVSVRAYHVELTFAFERRDTYFTGHCRVELQVNGLPRSVFYLHSSGLDILGATVDGVRAEVAASDSARATHYRVASDYARTGCVTVEVWYTGPISRTAPEGLSLLEALSADDGENAEELELTGFPEMSVLGTHLEPTHARDLFPCIDLPSSKAVFYLTLHNLPAHLSVISNNEILRTVLPEQVEKATEAEPEREAGINTPAHAGAVANKSVTFRPTPIMPAYIFGFWVGEFRCISTQALSPASSTQEGAIKDHAASERDSPLLCCGTPVPPLADSVEPFKVNVHVLGYVDLRGARFALDFTRRACALFSRLFSVPFPLPKLDVIGLPRMHGLGMENFGAITLLQVLWDLHLFAAMAWWATRQS